MNPFEKPKSVESPTTIEVKLPPKHRELSMSGDAKDFTYIIPISEALEDILPMKESITLNEGEFLKKKEFHVTALGFGTKDMIKEQVEVVSKRGEDLVQKINEILSQINFSFKVDLNSIKLIHNNNYDREAVIKKTGRAAFESEYTITIDIEMPGMIEYYNRMREIGIDLGQPATHVTLCIKQNGEATGLGIAITDFDEQVQGNTFPYIESRPLSADVLKQ